MNSDGTVRIDIDIPIDQALKNTKIIEDSLSKIGDHVGDGMDDSFEKESNQLVITAEKAKKSANEVLEKPIKPTVDSDVAKKAIESLVVDFKRLPTKTQTELNAKAEQKGFKSFESMLQSLPKEKATRLLADNKDGTQKVAAFRKIVNDIPERHSTEVDVNDKGSSALKEYSLRLKDVVTGSIVFQGVTKAVNAVTGQLGDAVKRFDTLNNFPKIMESMGVSSKDAKESINQLSEGVQGLPTALNDVAATTQRFFPVLDNNIQDATKSSIALNDAFIASGASGEDASRGLQQYLQMLESGKVDQQSWMSIAQTMPKSLQEVAKSFGIASGSQQELYKKLQSGQVSMKELNSRFIELDGGVKGFHKQALLATGGIGTAMTNMKNRITSGLTEAIKSFDETSKKMTGKTLSDNINVMSSVIGSSLKKVGQYIGELTPVFTVVGKVITGVWNGLKSFAESLGSSFMTNITKVSKSGFVDFWSGVGKNVDNVMKSLKPVMASLGDLVGVIAGSVWKNFSGLLSGIADGFGGVESKSKGINGIIDSIKNAFKNWYAAIEPLEKPLGKIIGALTNGAINGVKGVIDAIAGAFKSLSSKTDGAKSSLGPIGDVLSGIASHKEALATVGKVVGALVTAFLAFKAAMVVVNAAMVVFNALMSPWVLILGAIVLAVVAVVEAFKHWNDIKKWIDGVGKWFGDLWKDIKKSWDNFWGGIGKWIGEIAGAAKKEINKALKDIQKGWDDFWGGIGKWVDKVVSDIQKSFDKGWKAFTKWLGALGKDLSKVWNKIWSPLSKWFSEFWDGLVDIVQKFFRGLKTVIAYGAAIILAPFVLLWKAIEKPVVGIFNSITKTITKALNNTAKFIQLSMKVIQDVWEDVWGAVSSFFTKTWNGIVKNTTNFMKSISKAIDTATKWIQDAWKDVWGDISSFFGKIWSAIVKNTSNFMKSVSNAINSSIKWIQGVWEDVWGAISSFFSGIWNAMVKFVTDMIRTISNAISSTVKSIQIVWNNVWGAISSFFTGIWNGMVKFFTPIISTISSTISSVIKGIQTTWNNVWGGIGKFFGDIWDGIKSAAQNGINFVIDVIRTGLGAVNGVLGFFGVDKVKLPEHVHFATGGRVNGEEGEFVEINDGGGAHWKEAVQLPNGDVHMTDKRHARGWLPAGSHIFNGEETYQMAQAAGIKHYAGGGDVLKSIWNGVKGAASWVGDKASDVASWIGEKWNAMTDWIAHPVKHVTDLINKSIGGLVNSAPLKWVGQLGQGIFNKAFGGIGNWIKKHLEPIKKKHDEEAESIGSGPMKSLPQLEAIARQAASIMKVNPSDSFIKALANVAMSESGGNAGVANNWDVNAQAGLASVGLLQYIPTTWSYYAMPGHGNRSSVLDNFMTFFNNSDWANSIGYVTYPSWNGMYKWDWRNNGPHGGRRFENGGWASEASIFGEKDGEPEVAINPKRDSADQLILEAISARIKANPASPLNMLKEKPTIYNSYMQPTEKSVDQPTIHRDKSNDNLVDATKVYVQSVVNADGRNIAKAAYVPLSEMLQKGNNAKRGGVVFNG